MFCPRCKCEFRSGYKQCASCNVDLVDSLDTAQGGRIEKPVAPAASAKLGDICGFLDLEEARRLRDQFHLEGIAAEIAIRPTPDTPPQGAVVEEYWLRADVNQAQKVKALLEGETVPEDSEFKCSNCGRPVRQEESFCANCGLRFEG